MLIPTTQDMIDNLTASFNTQHTDVRQRHMFEQALHALVRLTRSEQILEMRTNVKKLTEIVAFESESCGFPASPRA